MGRLYKRKLTGESKDMLTSGESQTGGSSACPAVPINGYGLKIRKRGYVCF
ncbi:hypothetical protein CBFG_00772 [Clostridiales bacterium 1_7_47FAA]|nr:hypothetical protein CBFG_00772 [Clostridiales bacterium 1_7_47FAA]